MMRKLGVLALAAILLVDILSPLLVRAQTTLTVTESSVSIEFPTRLTFNVSAKSDVNITDIRLRYLVKRDSFAQVFSESFVEITPSATVKGSWTWDMRRSGGLPPGASLSYWWLVKDASGNQMETTPRPLDFNDTRFSWRNITESNVILFWYEGNDAFARQLMDSAQQAISRLARDTGAHLEKPVKIYIYANARDLQSALVFSSEWTGGVSFGEHGIIAIGIGPGDLDWGKRAMAHELTHQVIRQMTFNPYNDLPVWLNEGIAVYNESTLVQPQFSTALAQAITQNRLITLRSLSSPFSAYGDVATLSYAQSWSAVDFLIATYGQPKMLELLNTFREGSTFDGAFQKVYGLNMDELHSLWLKSVAPQPSPAPRASRQSILTVIGRLAAKALLFFKRPVTFLPEAS